MAYDPTNYTPTTNGSFTPLWNIPWRIDESKLQKVDGDPTADVQTVKDENGVEAAHGYFNRKQAYTIDLVVSKDWVDLVPGNVITFKETAWEVSAYKPVWEAGAAKKASLTIFRGEGYTPTVTTTTGS
jgi:hypothetical protein